MPLLRIDSAFAGKLSGMWFGIYRGLWNGNAKGRGDVGKTFSAGPNPSGGPGFNAPEKQFHGSVSGLFEGGGGYPCRNSDDRQRA